MVNTFGDVFRYLNQLEVLDSLLPFLLVFAITYAIFRKSQILGDRKNIDTIISLIMGLLVVLPHIWYGSGGGTINYGGRTYADPVVVINNSLPQVSVLIVAILMVMLILGMFGFSASWVGGLQGWMVFLAVLFVGTIFLDAAGWWELSGQNWFGWFADPGLQTAVVVILVFAVIIWFVTKDDTPKGGNVKFGDVMRNIGSGLNEFMGGSKR